ncbi:S8 family serine peptidase [Candidatus Poribacteria bacterium]|nr:S8 family serine peptidase [Candidatus Poribacteria bacterium]
MTKKSIYIYILVSFINAQFVFAQSNSDNFSQITHTPGELIVRLRPNVSSKQFDRLSRKLGAVSVSPVFSPTTPAGQHALLRRNYLIQFPAAWALEPLRQRYARHPAIEAVEMNRLNRPCAEVVPNDPSYDEQWNLALMNMSEAWGIEQGTPAVTVAVVDGGVDMQHPEFRSQLWRNAREIPRNGIDDDGNGYVDDINGWDFSDAPTLPGSGDWTVRDNEPEDEIGHGTHVSGIIAAAANNGIGIAGIAWRCRLMPLRADFKYGGGGYLQNDDVAAAIVYAADNGAQVINMSWGDTVNAFIIEDAIAYAYARGCVLVAAAGNDGAVGSWYPAGLKTVISVAGIDAERQLYTDSNFGATIDIAAPGDEILSTYLNGGYQNLSGTSMAAAHVSGVAALVLSGNPDYTNAGIKETLITTAEPLFISGLVGAGLLDASAALTASTELIAQIDTHQISLQTTESSDIEKIEIFGSAGGIGFTEYWLEYGIGEVPNLWFPLGTVQTKPKFNVCLYKWDTSGLSEGQYTVRLSVQSENGNSKRDRTVVEVNRTAPRISMHESQAWFVGNTVESVVMWQTHEVSIGGIEIFQANGNVVRTARSDSENFLHIVNLSDLGISTGAYKYRLSMENRAGLLSVDDNNKALYEIEMQNAPINPLHLSAGTSTARARHAVGPPVDINRNGRLELITAEMGTNLVQIIEIAVDGSFREIFAFNEPFLPRAILDTDKDGLIEILCNSPEATFLLEQPTQNGFPTERIWESQGHWSIAMVDADADGKPEIFTRADATNSILVYEAVGDNNHRPTATFENLTLGSNGIRANAATGDFDNDGQMEILIGDSDGDVFVYEAIGNNQYRQTWAVRLPEGSPQLFAAGDMDGDGKAEFAVCAMTGTEVGTIVLDIRYNHWLLTVFTSDGDDTYRPVWTQRIHDVRNGGNGMTIADANNDGQNELCLALAPNFYLVQYDGIDYRPIWHHAATNTFNPIVVDTNGDGENVLLFNSNNALTVFGTPTALNLQSSGPLSIPWNITAKPVGPTSVQLSWQIVPNVATYTLYRGESEDSVAQIREGIQGTDFTDRELTAGRIYWYALTSQDSSGKSSARSIPVSVVATQRPRLRNAVYSPPNQLSLAFDKPMGISATYAGRYRLHKQRDMASGIESYTPRSAILDKTGHRVVLTFPSTVFRTGSRYQIEALQLSDIHGADLEDEARILTVTLPVPELGDIIVYPNPVEFDQVTFDNLPVGTNIYIYDVSGNCIASFAKTEHERDKKVWDVSGISSGIYIYVLSSEKDRRVGKLTIIR